MAAGRTRSAFVEQEDHVNMEHARSVNQSNRKIGQSSGLWRASPRE